MTRSTRRDAWRTLTGHYFRSHFDLGVLPAAAADNVRRMALGALAGLVALGFLVARVFLWKYSGLVEQIGAEGHRATVAADETFILALLMALAAFVAVLVCRSMFPSETDYRVLMTLPVTKGAVFGAKLLGLGLLLGLFLAAAAVAIAPPFVLVSHAAGAAQSVPARLVALVVSGVAASVFSAGVVVTLVAIASVCTPRPRVQLMVGLLQTVMLCALVLALPSVFRLSNAGRLFASEPDRMYALPPAWFLGIGHVLLGDDGGHWLRLAEIGTLAFVVTAVVLVACSARLYQRFDRVILRPPVPSKAQARGSWCSLRERWQHPSSAAIGTFAALTLRRSALHRGVFAGIAAIGVGLALMFLVRADVLGWLVTGGEPSARLQTALTLTPLFLMFAAVTALRSALVLPVEPRANWVFRITEHDSSRRPALLVVERWFVIVGIVVPLSIVLPLYWLWLGAAGLVTLLMAALYGAVLVEIVLADWRRLPFTCTYVPGKRFIVQATLLAFLRFFVFVFFGATLLGRSHVSQLWTGAVLTVLVIIVAGLRWHRRQWWGRLPLEFEDALPETIDPIQLGAESFRAGGVARPHATEPRTAEYSGTARSTRRRNE